MQVKEIRGPISHQVFIESHGDATSVGNKTILNATYDLQIVSIQLVPDAAITANGTNFATYTATRVTAAGGTATTVATRSWAATDSVAGATESMTLSGTAANLLLTAGQNLIMIKTEDGSGLIIPSMLVVVTYKLTGV